MKIIRVVPYLDFGGVEKRIELTAKGFKSRPEHELLIVVLSGSGKTGVLVELMGYEVIYLNEDPKIPNIRLIKKLYNLFKTKKPDVIHCSGSEANFHGLWAAKLSGVPVRIGEEIGFPNHDWKWRKIFNWTYNFAHKVIGISEAVKRRLVDLGEVEAEKVRVAYNPVSIGENVGEGLGNKVLNTLKKNNDGQKPFVFITTCRLVPIKNLDMLVSVFSELANGETQKPMELWIVGDGPEKEKLKDMTIKLGILEKVKFWGFQEDVFPFLKHSDAFVLPSFSEGFSISLVEAMGCALPSIATNVGGPSEIIKHQTGFLVDPSNDKEILEKMQYLINLPFEERLKIGEAAKLDVTERFSIDKYIIQLLKVYTSVN